MFWIARGQCSCNFMKFTAKITSSITWTKRTARENVLLIYGVQGKACRSTKVAVCALYCPGRYWHGVFFCTGLAAGKLPTPYVSLKGWWESWGYSLFQWVTAALLETESNRHVIRVTATWTVPAFCAQELVITQYNRPKYRVL
jgi:hypothetical protein